MNGHLSPFKSSINRLASRVSNFTSSSSSGDATATNSIPIQGVKLSHLIRDFYVACGGRKKLKGLSTTEVGHLYVKPMTATAGQLSYCEYLRGRSSRSSSIDQTDDDVDVDSIDDDSNDDDDDGGGATGSATEFISHAWMSKFVDVMDALEHHFRDTPDVIVWMDLFSINQHHSADIDSSWLSSLRACIDSIGQAVMVLATPRRKARPLSRGWCLFELYCTIVTNSSFEVAMSKSQRDDFLSTLSLESTREALSIIDSANSKVSVDVDRKVIREELINEVGFTELNTMVSLTILNWIIATTEAVITATVQSDDDDDDLKLQLMYSLGGIYQHYGRYKLAEKCLTDEYAHRLCNQDRNHPDTETSMFNLA